MAPTTLPGPGGDGGDSASPSGARQHLALRGLQGRTGVEPDVGQRGPGLLRGAQRLRAATRPPEGAHEQLPGSFVVRLRQRQRPQFGHGIARSGARHQGGQVVLDEGAALVRPEGLDRPGGRGGRQLDGAAPHRAGAGEERGGPLLVALGPGVGRLAPAVGHHLDVEGAGSDPQRVGVAGALERGGLVGQRGQRRPDA